MYCISVYFLENIEVCAKAHGQIWSGRLQVTPWSAYRRDRDSLQDSNDVINDLVTELPDYLAAVKDVIMFCEEEKDHKVKWWKYQ